jgi:hypothetical protein
MGRKFDLAYCLGCIWIFTYSYYFMIRKWLIIGHLLYLQYSKFSERSSARKVCREMLQNIDPSGGRSCVMAKLSSKNGFLAEHCIPLLLANKQYIKLPNEVCPVSPTFCSFPTASFE